MSNNVSIRMVCFNSEQWCGRTHAQYVPAGLSGTASSKTTVSSAFHPPCRHNMLLLVPWRSDKQKMLLCNQPKKISGDKEYPVFTSRFAIINQHRFWMGFMSCCWPRSGNNNNNKIEIGATPVPGGHGHATNWTCLLHLRSSKLKSVPNPFVFLPSPVPLRRNEQSVKILPDSRTNIPKSFHVCMMQGKRCCTFFPPSDRLLVTFKNIACHMFHCYDPAPPHEFPEVWFVIANLSPSIVFCEQQWTTCIQTFGFPRYLRGCSQHQPAM